jgi:hypothetical protein
MKTRTESEGLAQHVAWVSAMMCALLTACTATPKAVRDLPELPAELAKDLAVARTAPVLVTRPAAAAAQAAPRPAGPPVSLVPSKACTSIYEGYVTYPITVCYQPTELFETLDLSTSEAPATTPGTAVPAPRYFKLTAYPQVTFGRAWFCTVRGGPWYGRVEGAQICNANPNVRAFKAELLGAPEPVVVLWSGILNDVPPPLNLVGISLSGESCVCCSGTMCPDGRCVPQQQQCEVMPPALR